MAASVLATAPFVQTQLKATLPGSGWTVDPVTGNPIPAPGQTVTLMAFVAPYRFDQLRLLPGADTELIRGRGELVAPLEFPTGIGVGSVLKLTYAGQAYDLTITTLIENDLPVVAFGTYFGFTMRLSDPVASKSPDPPGEPEEPDPAPEVP